MDLTKLIQPGRRFRIKVDGSIVVIKRVNKRLENFNIDKQKSKALIKNFDRVGEFWGSFNFIESLLDSGEIEPISDRKNNFW